MKENKTPKIHHISDLLSSFDPDGDHWKELISVDNALPLQFYELLVLAIALPLDLYSIICAYAFLPTNICRKVPYLFFYGASGSGKSTLAN